MDGFSYFHLFTGTCRNPPTQTQLLAFFFPSSFFFFLKLLFLVWTPTKGGFCICQERTPSHLISWLEINLCDSFTLLLSEHEPEGTEMAKFPNLPKIYWDKGWRGHVVSCNHRSLATQWKDISDSTCLYFGQWADRTEWPSLGAATLCCLLRGWGTVVKPLCAAPLGPRLVNVLSQAVSTHVKLGLLCYIYSSRGFNESVCFSFIKQKLIQLCSLTYHLPAISTKTGNRSFGSIWRVLTKSE